MILRRWLLVQKRNEVGIVSFRDEHETPRRCVAFPERRSRRRCESF